MLVSDFGEMATDREEAKAANVVIEEIGNPSR
jgi:hypothetical protein